MLMGGAVLGEGNQSVLVDASSLIEAHRKADGLLQNQMNQAGAGAGGVSSSFSHPSVDGSFLFTANGGDFGIITPVPPAGSTSFQTADGTRFHLDGNVNGLPGGQGVETTVSVENRGSGGTSFVLAFSEPMDKDTVEDNFSIRSFDSSIVPLDGGTIGGNTATPDNSNIWDQGGYDVDWNSDGTEVTFTFPDDGSPLNPDSNENLPGADFLATYLVDFDPSDDPKPATGAIKFRVESENPGSQLEDTQVKVDTTFGMSAAVAILTITDTENAGIPQFIFQDGFSSSNITSWSRTEDP